MGEEIALETGGISNFEGLMTLTLDRVIQRIPSCITHLTLPAYQISLESKKLFVDERTYGRTDERTFETHFIRSTRRSQPNGMQMCRPYMKVGSCDLETAVVVQS